MKHIAFVVGIGVFAGASFNAAPPQEALAQLREALGGEAALGAVRSIRARGTIEAKPHDDHFDLAVALPDRFVAIERRLRWTDASWSTGWADVPGNWPQRFEPILVGGGESASEFVTGFDGNIPLPIRYDAKKNPGDVARWLERPRAKMAEFLLPLIAGTPASYPVFARSEAHAIHFSAAGGREWRLELDPVTHLPANMSWTYPLQPMAPPTAKPQRVRTEFSDFRVVGGLRWPHRLLTYRDGQLAEDATVKRYEVNVKLSDKMFRK